jgi:hypothetical protein
VAPQILVVFFFKIAVSKKKKKKTIKGQATVKQLFGKKRVFLHAIVQKICFKMPVKNLNSCQTIVRQKRRFSTGNMQSNCLLLNILLPK